MQVGLNAHARGTPTCRRLPKKTPPERGLLHSCECAVGYLTVPPAAAVSAFCMALGLGMIFMKLFWPIIFRSG